MSVLAKKSWSPYAVGILIGALSMFAFWSASHPLGVSTVMVRTVAVAEDAVAPGHVTATPYLAKLRPFFNWEFALVVGLLLGSFMAWKLGGGERAEKPEGGRIWEALGGGFLLLFGARLAGGCTSGHGISGSLQLALSGWVFFLTIFASAIAAAFLLKNKEGK
ncbi:MAG: YeeE/YedE family protein [Acidobacteria bacterium]|nr:YeeE/YedE family protein [Acidobacteriota bacterium]